jgi:hypothetical protein
LLTEVEDEHNPSGHQIPTKHHFHPLNDTIDKKRDYRKPFFMIFPLQDNDLAHFSHK